MALEKLQERVSEFFRSQPYGEAVGLDRIAEDITADDLKRLVPDDAAAAAADQDEKEKKTVPTKKAERLDYGRKTVLFETLDEMTKANKLKRAVKGKADKGAGLGWIWQGEAPATLRDIPPDQLGHKRFDKAELPIDQIRIDKNLQQRADGIDEATVAEYAQHPELLPAVRVFKDKEGVYWLSRGFHRMQAWKKAGWDKVPVEIFDGEKEDAKIDACGDNATHGRRRTRHDIRKAVETLMKTPAHKYSPTATIANIVGIAWETCSKIMEKIRKDAEKPDEPAEPRTIKTKKGKTRKATAKRKATAAKPPAAKPPAEPVQKSSGVLDRTGADVPGDRAAVFMDNRFVEAIANIRLQLTFLRELRTDYAFSSLGVNERGKVLAEIETKLETLELSAPYATVPDGAKVDTAIARRTWMTKAEYDQWVKAKKPMKDSHNPAPAAPINLNPLPVNNGQAAAPVNSQSESTADAAV